MPATNNTTARLTINDFKPGIFSDYHSSTAPTASPGQSTFDPSINGAAVIEDTWGCCADRSGALVPLPRVTLGKSSALVPNGNGSVSSHGTNLPGTYLLDAILVEDMQVSNERLTTETEVITMQTFVYLNGDQALHHSYLLVRRYQEWRIDQQTTDISFTKSMSTQMQAEIASGNLFPFRGYPKLAAGPTSLNTRKGVGWVAHPLRTSLDALPVARWFAGGDMGTNDRLITDYDTKSAVVQSSAPQFPTRVRESLLGWFPDFNQTESFNMGVSGHANTVNVEDFRGGFMAVSHQGRVIIAQWLAMEFGGQFTWKDRITSSGLLLIDTLGGSGEFVEENTSGIGVMASMSADELIVIKHQGGGFLLRGSVESPTITKLPFIESTYGIVSSPALTPLGLIYGSRNGVFAWTGGETSQHVSPQLDGFFWNHAPNTKYQGHQARFDWWHPWVMVPNGFMLDSRHNSWWRLDNPADHEPYNVYRVSQQGRLYAFPWRLTSTANLLWNQASPDVLTSSWSWKSQPLVETREQTFKLRDITVLATATDPNSTITVTVSGFNQAGALVTIPPVVIALSDISDRPQLVMRDLGQQAESLTYIQVRLEGLCPTLTAPKLHSISFGVLDDKPARKS